MISSQGSSCLSYAVLAAQEPRGLLGRLISAVKGALQTLFFWE